MRDLFSIQQAFQNFILMKEKENSIETEILSLSNVTVATRLGIYQDAYYSRLIDVLKQDYQILLALMGENDFETLAKQYIHANPSHHRSIRWFSEKFSQFIASQRPEPNLSWQTEMAQFEWLLMMAFDAGDAPLLTVQEMAETPFTEWSCIHFCLHPSIQQLQLCWNTVAVWNALQGEHQITELYRAKTPTNWIIWRKELEIQFCSLSKEESYMISAIKAGRNFGSICEGLCDWIDSDEVAHYAASLLKRFIMDNLLIKDF